MKTKTTIEFWIGCLLKIWITREKRRYPSFCRFIKKGVRTENYGMRESSGNAAEVLPVGAGAAVLVLSELESMASRQQREIAQQKRLLEQREAQLAVLRGAHEPAQQDRLARLRHRLDQQQTKLNRLRLLRSQTDQSRVSNATLRKLQLLGTNQQHLQNNTQILVNQSSSNSNVNANNNGNNNNNNKNSNQNKYILENQTSSQIFRIHGTQQSQKQGNLQQKCPNAVNISNSNLASNTQVVALIKNHGNVRTHQKPVSSVAPSFPVKSPIYQTSSTKIHPVMPQTLNFIGKINPGAQNYNALSVQSQNNQLSANIQSNVNQELNSLSRINQLGTTHHQQENITQSKTNQAQGSHTAAQSMISLSAANLNFNNYSYQSAMQPQGICTMTLVSEHLIDKLKLEPAKNQDKFEHLSATKHESQIRHEQNALMYDSPQNKYEQHDKYDQATQPLKIYEQTPKLDQSYVYKTNVYEDAAKRDLNSVKQEGSHVKLEHKRKLDNPTKYDNGSVVHQVKQHEQRDTQSSIKFNQPLSFKHELVVKCDTSKESLSKSNQVNHEQNQTNFENTTTKYEHNFQILQNDHTIQFEALNKPLEKPSEYEQLIAQRERMINSNELNCEDKTKPTLPPKSSKPNLPPRLNNHEILELTNDVDDDKATTNQVYREEKEEDIPPMPTSEPPESPTQSQSGNQHIIKSRPVHFKKVPISEHSKLRYSKSNIHVSINRRIEMPPAFLFPETEIPADLIQADVHQYQHSQQQQTSNQTVKEESGPNEKLEDVDIVDSLNFINIENKIKMKSDKDRKPEVEFESKPTETTRRKKGNLKSTTGKANLSRRVSFDPLALLLDASLEGEVELVKKTAKEVSDPSSANDEGITALHNAICAGHLEIVKFLVEFGCDVNAQDSDGWTPLHCAASCNNLAMVRFLVEHGACIFATTLSDHETAAEKCEEDEEGFDGCSEYLYSVQEKLGIMNNGQVFALFDYSPQHSDELLLKNGDSFVVLRKGDDDEREWWWSKLGNKEGYVPRNLLGLYARVKPTKVDRNHLISTKDQ
ncbi:putative uncharacterized protein DDB_G0271606 isoform X2 [Belonocnema kinseyi]|uniref:putative uncharacterized protein DDB_G0271606 isoform X2 n=1 Tax=Belonocnema kinseyi TaxID=2817044 RepID=UPI00143D4A8B|nr:putative uncharacterized protein DDB_G0271606 isoform X2 [Belonocnema kinseyi]